MITNLIPALGWTLLHSLWQGALLFLVVVPLLAALHNKSSQLRYGVVCTALLLLLGGMGLTFGALLEFTPTSASPSSATLVSILPVNDNATAAVIATETAAVSSFTSSPTKEAFSFTRFLEENVTYLVAIWGLGVLGFALRWFSLLLLTLRLRTRGVRRLSADWQQRLRQLSLRMNVRQQVGLLESDQVDTPLVIGWIKPVILLPVGLVSGLTIAQVEAILAHELAHISRRDFLVNLFFTSLEVVLFYHPFYWWIMTKINEEREQCCDDVAVAACGNPRMYAYTLLSVEEHRQSGMFAMAFARKGGQLQQRIQRICQVTPRYGQSLSLRFWLLLPLLAFVAAFTYAGTYPDRVGEKAFAEQEAVGETEELTPPEVPVATATFLPALPAQEEPLYTITPETVVDRLPNAGRLVVPLAQMDLPAVVIVHEPVGRSKRVARLDSLPRPVIPTMAAEPELPAAPTFSLSGDEVAKLLDGGDAERTKLREATTGFRDQINDWNERVNEEYLEVWGDHRERIMDAYAGWNESLRAEADSELAYALAHEEMVQAYEDAFSDHEDSLGEVEEAIANQPEFDTESIERLIGREEKSIKEHSDRMRVHSIRMGMHSVRMKIHSSRMQVHSSRMKMHTARMKMHSQRMKSHQIIMAALEQELRQALIADGYLKKGDKEFIFKVTSTSISFNGKTIKSEDAANYRKLLARYGKADFEANQGNTFMIQIDGTGRKMQ